MARLLLVIVCGSLLLGLSVARPPVKTGTQNQPQQEETKDANWGDLGVEYNRYLQEVVEVLESDPEFRKKLENAETDKIRDGSIASELEFVNHNVRNKLDDIKRKELERLRHYAMKQYELTQGVDRKHIKVPQHLEIKTPTFEIDDLKRLIQSTTKDLEEADQKRRDEFKRYEMEKKFEEEERLKHIQNEEDRKKEEHRLKEMKEKHNKHEKLNHPMTKDQLEEVWEEQDHMRPEDWDPKTFFAMHDLDGNGLWDEDEIKALFKKELDKAYDPNAPEDDMREREEEMERMREHVFKESDVNKDHMISYDEFLTETKRDEFEKDPGWDTIDQQPEDDFFNEEEFRAYELQRQREIQAMINAGQIPPGYPYYGDMPHGGQPFVPPPPGSIPGQQAYHPQQGVPIHPQQMAGHPQQMAGHPQQFQGQPQQFQGQPQQFQGQPQQFQGQAQQFQGQPQHVQGQAQQFQGQPQQGQPQHIQGQPQQFQGQAQQFQGQPQHVQGQAQQFQGQPQQGQPQGQAQPRQPVQPAVPVGQPQPGQQGGQQQAQFQGQQVNADVAQQQNLNAPQPRGGSSIRQQPPQQQ